MPGEHLVGEFDKPAYVRPERGSLRPFALRRRPAARAAWNSPDRGNHARRRPCRHFRREICAGCGACAAVCPTGAVTYALLPADALLRRMRTLLVTYAEAGGRDAVVLLLTASMARP